MIREYEADFVVLSGWLKLVKGLDPKTTVNIHPALLPDFGGPGMYGMHVHRAVMEAYRRGEVNESGFTIHFVDPEYDRGSIAFQFRIPIRPDDTPETLAVRVNEKGRAFQSGVIDDIVHYRIELGETLTRLHFTYHTPHPTIDLRRPDKSLVAFARTHTGIG